MKNLGHFFLNKSKNQSYLVGIATASGAITRICQQDGGDFVSITNSGKYRQNGHSSMCGFMPYENSNSLIQHTIEREILPIATEIPVIASIFCHDVFSDISSLIDSYAEMGVSGISNYPTITSIDGSYRKALEDIGYTLDRELQMLEKAHKKGLFTVAFVMKEEDIEKCLQYPIDMICIDCGLTEGGYFGGSHTITIRELSEHIAPLYNRVKQHNYKTLFGVYGGPISSPEDINLFYHFLKIDAFLGGSLFERIPLENASRNVFFELHRNEITQSSVLKKASREYMHDCLKYIDSHYYKDISLNELAYRYGVTPQHLSKKFHMEVGVPLSQYLIETRLQKSVEMMQIKKLSLVEIAELTGFHDYSYYSKTFKKYNGLSPRDYRLQKGLA